MNENKVCSGETSRPAESVPFTRNQDFSGELITPDNVGTRTTIMLRNLPNDLSAHAILTLLDSEGFAGLYNFFYLPMDLRRNAGLGYCWINLVDPAHVLPFWR